MNIYNVETLVIVLVSGLLIIESVRNYICMKEWYDIVSIILGCLWLGLYLFVLFFPPYNPVWFGQTFIRHLNWLTLSMIVVLRRYLKAKQYRSGHYDKC